MALKSDVTRCHKGTRWFFSNLQIYRSAALDTLLTAKNKKENKAITIGARENDFVNENIYFFQNHQGYQKS